MSAEQIQNTLRRDGFWDCKHGLIFIKRVRDVKRSHFIQTADHGQEPAVLRFSNYQTYKDIHKGAVEV